MSVDPGFESEPARSPAPKDGAGAARGYSGPAFVGTPLAELSDRQRRMIRKLYPGEDVEPVFFDGHYIGRRTRIDVRGVWQFYVAGD